MLFTILCCTLTRKRKNLCFWALTDSFLSPSVREQLWGLQGWQRAVAPAMNTAEMKERLPVENGGLRQGSALCRGIPGHYSHPNNTSSPLTPNENWRGFRELQKRTQILQQPLPTQNSQSLRNLEFSTRNGAQAHHCLPASSLEKEATPSTITPT